MGFMSYYLFPHTNVVPFGLLENHVGRFFQALSRHLTTPLPNFLLFAHATKSRNLSEEHVRGVRSYKVSKNTSMCLRTVPNSSDFDLAQK
jgi:hypothetical protein